MSLLTDYMVSVDCLQSWNVKTLGLSLTLLLWEPSFHTHVHCLFYLNPTLWWLTVYFHVISARLPLGLGRQPFYIGNRFAAVKGSALKMLRRIMTSIVLVHIALCVCVRVCACVCVCVCVCVCRLLLICSGLFPWIVDFLGTEIRSPPAELNLMFLKS